MQPEITFANAQSRDHDFTVAVLPVEARTLQHLAILSQGGESPDARLGALADALSVSPLWAEMPRATLVVRAVPDPLLGVVGYFDAAGRARLEALRWQLEHILPRLRYVGYAQAQKDCERLAARLVERFGRDELRGFRFVAIPRGGLIVLGMLAYILGLERSQLEPSQDTGAPLMIVDDCALSGVRFREFLSHLESSRVVFAHLYSSPELREAIEVRESGRVTCLSAHDLGDHAQENLGEQHLAWKRRWLERMNGQGYWVGQGEQVCFAWNEPDFGFWNPVTEREENGWRFLPPDLCLKNRPLSGAHPILVQFQPQGKGPLRPSSSVVFGEFEGQVAVGNLKTGESFILEGVGTDMWRAVVEYGNLEEAADALLKTYEIDGATLRADLREFVEDLLSQSLLENRA
jgi:Coenzyme PQQ synthesis protein D (PqqD)